MKESTKKNVYTIYKCHHPGPYGIGTAYDWSIEPVHDAYNSEDPYIVEVPDGFYIDETVLGERLFFKDGETYGYELVAVGENGERAVLIGFGGVIVELEVIKA